MGVPILEMLLRNGSVPPYQMLSAKKKETVARNLPVPGVHSFPTNLLLS